MITVDISNDPVTGLKRKSENSIVIINDGERYVEFSQTVKYFTADGVDTGISKVVNLRADDVTLVHATTGLPVAADYTGATKTAYQWFLDNSQFDTLRRNAVLRADSAGKFNI